MTIWVGGDPKIFTLEANAPTRQCRYEFGVGGALFPGGVRARRSAACGGALSFRQNHGRPGIVSRAGNGGRALVTASARSDSRTSSSSLCVQC